MKKQILIFAFTIFHTTIIFSNNISISNVSLTGKNTTDHFCMVQFDLTWENSWRVDTGAMNWDAVWVFVKFRIGETGEWQHASLSTISYEHFAPSGSTIDATQNRKGVFIYRDAAGRFCGRGNPQRLRS